ncbi:hypothetical protein DCC79_09685 [bacterium]|nr:MAG: hypothetical protein DCC79_09685 [bacterium]
MLTLRHCPRCRALQPAQPACGVCGADLGAPPGGGEPAARLPLREAAALAGFLVAGLGGFVLAAAAVLVLVFLALG